MDSSGYMPSTKRPRDGCIHRGAFVMSGRNPSLPDERGIRNRIRVRRLRTSGRAILLLDVVDQHAAGAELWRDGPDGLLGDLDPVVRQVVRIAAIVQRHDLALEQVVHRVGLILVRRGALLLRGLEPPAVAVALFPALDPPAVEDREVRDTVRRGLHAAGAGRLERVTWVVHPHIDAGHEVLRKAHLVILDERNASTEPRIPRLKVDLLDELLAALIGRVGLAGEDELDWALRVGQDPGQPIDIAEEQRRALVRRETPGETEREDVRVLERSG